jgi:hypothetical protein
VRPGEQLELATVIGGGQANRDRLVAGGWGLRAERRAPGEVPLGKPTKLGVTLAGKL